MFSKFNKSSFFFKPLFISRFLLVLFIIIALGAYFTKNQKEDVMKITSSAFSDKEMIPSKYTCDGKNISPPLLVENIPPNAKSLALIMDDPDAPLGTFVHWVMYNMPVNITDIPEKIPSLEVLGNGSAQGINDFRKIGYGGPCPPSGTHRYFFKLYALDEKLELPPGLTKSKLEEKINSHIIAKEELVGLYKR